MHVTVATVHKYGQLVVVEMTDPLIQLIYCGGPLAPTHYIAPVIIMTILWYFYHSLSFLLTTE